MKLLDICFTLMRQRGNTKKSMEYHTRSIKIIKNLHGEINENLANEYSNLAFLYRDLGDFNASLEYHELTLKIRLNLFGEDN